MTVKAISSMPDVEQIGVLPRRFTPVRSGACTRAPQCAAACHGRRGLERIVRASAIRSASPGRHDRFTLVELSDAPYGNYGYTYLASASVCIAPPRSPTGVCARAEARELALTVTASCRGGRFS